MYASIWVRQKTKGNQSFDYLIPDFLELEKYSLVEIPFGKKKATGLIESLKTKSPKATKEISRKLSGGAILTQKQVEFAEIIAREYFSSLQESIFSFLPRINKKDFKKINKASEFKPIGGGKDTLLIYPFWERQEYIFKKISRSPNQNLIVLPTITECEYFKNTAKKITADAAFEVWHSQISSAKKTIIWNKLLNEQRLTIIGTRHSLFLPFTRLENIFIEDPTNFAYQEDQAPRYNAYRAALLLRKITKANLTISENIPDLLSFAALLNKKINLISKPITQKILVGERWTKFRNDYKNYPAIKKALKQNQRILIVGPWHNQARLFCRDCEKNIACPKCKTEYVDESSGFCPSCQTEIISCPKCRGLNLVKVGFSAKKMAAEFANLFSVNPQKIATKATNFNDLQIVLANPRERELKNGFFDIVLFPYFDHMLNFPRLGYRQGLLKFIFGLNRFKPKKIVILGDNLAKSQFVNDLINGNWQKNLIEELKERKAMNLPPFSTAIKIICKAKTLKLAQENLTKFEKTLKPTFDPINLGYDQTSVSHRAMSVIFVKPKLMETFHRIFQKNKGEKIYLEINPGDYY